MSAASFTITTDEVGLDRHDDGSEKIIGTTETLFQSPPQMVSMLKQRGKRKGRRQQRDRGEDDGGW